MGTVNICECVRKNPCVKSFLNVTTDKVYLNREWEWGYREDDPLDGYDPYSNSKSCSELVTHSYIHSFYDKMDVAVSTARAGNVIGGGDFCEGQDYSGLCPGSNPKAGHYCKKSIFCASVPACVGTFVCVSYDCSWSV